MINLVYDIPLSDTVKFSLGGGVGIGGFRGSLRTTGTTFDIFRGGNSAFQWQAIAGLRWHRAGCGSVRRISLSRE